LLRAPAFEENTVDISLGLHYDLSHKLAFTLGYTHTEISSQIDAREYTRNRYIAGVNFTF
jgi:uncharacterized protein (PEP-CTERM system associated)